MTKSEFDLINGLASQLRHYVDRDGDHNYELAWKLLNIADLL